MHAAWGLGPPKNLNRRPSALQPFSGRPQDEASCVRLQVCGYISLRPLVHGRCLLCQAELSRFLRRQANQLDARLAGKQSRAAAAAAAAAAASAASAAALAEASVEGQRARRADAMRRELQRGMDQVGTWIGGLVEGVTLPGVGARQLADG